MSAQEPSSGSGQAVEHVQEGQKPAFDHADAMQVLTGIGDQCPHPVQPVQLGPGDTFSFRCHRGATCWNACCHGADVTLTPCDMLRLSRHLGVRPAGFLETYTVPAEHAASGMPVAKLKMAGTAGDGPCAFMRADGCSVYADRPLTCRYYPLGLVSHKLKGAATKDEFHFLVREPHCQGHLHATTQTVADFRREQGVADDERINRGWVDILMKLASWRSAGGPPGMVPSPQARQMFFMVSTDVDRFRRFVFETRFLKTYDVPADAIERIKSGDEALLQLGFAWLESVLFHAPTLGLRPEVLQSAIARARADLGAG